MFELIRSYEQTEVSLDLNVDLEALRKEFESCL